MLLRIRHPIILSHCHRRIATKTQPTFIGNGQVEIPLSNGRIITLTCNRLARMTDGTCLAKFGNSSVMATAVSKVEAAASSFMPLTVDYRQRAAAAGRIPTNYLRRELGPTEKEILTGRMIDRALRPVFPQGYFSETQLVCNLLAVDGVHDPEVLSINAASAALATSDIPWDGPIGAVRVGLLGDKNDVIINPTRKELAESKLNMVVAGKNDKRILMIDGSASEPISMNNLIKALSKGLNEIKRIIMGIELLVEKEGKIKRPFEATNQPTEEHLEAVRRECLDELRSIFKNSTHDKQSRDVAVQEVRKRLEKLTATFPDSSAHLSQAFNDIFKEAYTSVIVETGIRCDGRTEKEIRPISCEVSLFEPLHGSALFQRGQTQVLCSVTLDSPNSVFKSDPVSILTGGLKEKNFMLHYEFPPFATNEISRIGGRNRRELGHGALAEKALRPLIPHNFPFTIRLSCDVLESNGSSSMASVCAGSMALMDAGVDIKENAAGVAMGLLKIPNMEKEDDSFILLTDILGLEDYTGEMDFKIAGTLTGFTALQLDVKLKDGLPYSVIFEALVRGHEAKGKIVKIMNGCISSHKTEKDSWPVSRKLQVPQHKRQRFFGFGGMNLKRLTAETGVQVTEDLEDTSSFILFAPNKDAMYEAEEFIQKLLEDTEPVPELEFGGIYDVTIVEIKEHGVLATVHEKLPPVFIQNKELDVRKVSHASALDMEVGQTISVKYFGRDPVSGQMRISRRVLLMTSPKAVKLLPRTDIPLPSEAPK